MVCLLVVYYCCLTSPDISLISVRYMTTEMKDNAEIAQNTTWAGLSCQTTLISSLLLLGGVGRRAARKQTTQISLIKGSQPNTPFLSSSAHLHAAHPIISHWTLHSALGSRGNDQLLTPLTPTPTPAPVCCLLPCCPLFGVNSMEMLLP